MSRQLVLRAPRSDLSVRVPARAVVVAAALTLACLVVACLATAFGQYAISPWRVVQAALGHGSVIDELVVRQLRLPRILTGAAVGAALGLSGAIFQALTRNPLASPDLMGINEGAAVVAVWLILAGAGGRWLPLGAFAGATAAMLLVGLLAVRRHVSIYRVILVGIGINALAAALIAYMLTHAAGAAQLDRLTNAQQWLLGSLSGSTWHDVRLIGGSLLVLTPIALILGRRLSALQLGDDLARALGVSVGRLQLQLGLVGGLLAAVSVTVAGPIGFVAFVAPHIARRATRTPGAAALPAAMAVGALLVVVADYAAQRVLEPKTLPVGIATILIGAPYLLFLLYGAERRTGIA